MTRDDLIKMAREADFCVNEDGGISTSNSYGIVQGELEHFAALVAAAEREACAGLRKEIVLLGGLPTKYEEGFWDALAKYEDAIRARRSND